MSSKVNMKIGPRRSFLRSAVAQAAKLLQDDEFQDIDAQILSLNNCSDKIEKHLSVMKNLTEELYTTYIKEDVKEEDIKIAITNLYELELEAEEMLISLKNRLKDLGSQKARIPPITIPPPPQLIPNPTINIKLPKLELKKFSGELTEWRTFWDSFECVHKHPGLRNVDKMNHLVNKLHGEAAVSVSGLSISNANYEVAISILKERFGDVNLIISNSYNFLQNMPQASVSTLRQTYDSIEKILRSLEALGENVNSQLLLSLYMSKLPKSVLTSLCDNNVSQEKWTVQLLREKLKIYLTNREFVKAQYGTEDKLHTGEWSSWSENGLVAYSKNPVTVSFPSCHFCQNKHWSDECTLYTTIQQRKNKIKGACFVCLRRGHMPKECKSDKRCAHCNEFKKHHRSLCSKKFPSGAVSSNYSAKHIPQAFGAKNIPQTYGINNPVTKVGTNIPISTAANNIPINFNGHQSSVNNSRQPSGQLLASEEQGILPTATVVVENTDRSNCVKTRLLLDSGSQRTYVTSKLAKLLKLEYGESQFLSVYTFSSQNPKSIKTETSQVILKLRDNSCKLMDVNIVPEITASIQRFEISGDAKQKLEHFDLADNQSGHDESTIDMLIGSDYYWDLFPPSDYQRIRVEPGLFIISSKLGWILSGRSAESTLKTMNCHSLSTMTMLTHTSSYISSCLQGLPTIEIKNDSIEDFWTLECLGIKEEKLSEDDLALQMFNQTVTKEDGRYHISWPWRYELRDSLPSNYNLAYGRLVSVFNRLNNDAERMQNYNDIIADQESKQIIERVNINDNDERKNSGTHYLPHHEVITPLKATTKLRIVFDASAKTRRQDRSINECMLRGPSMMTDICGLFIRFRTKEIAIIADIEKAFLQIGLHLEDRDFTRFLWLKNVTQPITVDNIQVYRFCRVPFGMIASPFMLQAVIQYHLSQINSPVSKDISNHLYVDNLVTGVKSLSDAIMYYQEAKDIFTDAKMNLREWYSNSRKFIDTIPECDQGTSETLKVLGLTWDNTRDRISVRNIQEDMVGVSTKRAALRTVAQVFDPLGFFSPVTVVPKILIQQMWSDKIGWDAKLNEEQTAQWTEVVTELKKISSVSIPRYIGTLNENSQLICFADASSRAYGVVIYLKTAVNGVPVVNLVFSKARVAPLNKLSVPKLELMAVVIGTRSVMFIQKQLCQKFDEIIIFTDSKCVLYWFQASKLTSLFVKNRIEELKKHTNLKYRYITTSENPADFCTRGKTVHELCESNFWWQGPEWLKLDKNDWPTWQVPEINSEIMSKLEDENKLTRLYEVSMLNQEENSDCLSPFHIKCADYSSLDKLLRVTAWCSRIVNKMQKKVDCVGSHGNLHAKEIKMAEKLWLKHIQTKHFALEKKCITLNKKNQLKDQLNLYIDNEQLLRCEGRIDNSEWQVDTVRPVLLPKKDHYTTLVIQRSHRLNYHTGVAQTLANVRRSFWIPHGRTIVKNALKDCTNCKRVTGGHYKLPDMPSLPAERVKRSHPFKYCGLDIFGPLMIKDNAVVKKVWVCLYTCLVVRAVHLELVFDLSADEFLLNFRRFIARRGKPTQVFSDNAPQFKVVEGVFSHIWANIISDEVVQTFSANQNIQWKFIPQFAPWMGGYYERMVGIVKSSLRKTLGRLKLKPTQLMTVIIEVEAIVNNRPLMYVSENLEDLPMLTPAHFLSLNPCTTAPNFDIDEDDDYIEKTDSATTLLLLWKKGVKHLDEFWKLWHNGYLLSLRERYDRKIKTGRIQASDAPKIGDIVLIEQKPVPRNSWRLGKIIGLRNSEIDNKIRSANIRVSTGRILTRPIKLLYPIECSDDPVH